MLKVAPISSKGSCADLDETLKKGVCWFELKRPGMSQWGVYRPDKFQPENDHSIVKEEVDKKDDGEAIAAECPLVPEIQNKKRRLHPKQHLEAVTATDRCRKQRREGEVYRKSKKNKLDNSKERWSADRYKLAEQCMLEVLKAEGAVYENPIARPALRMAARKHIGDTGLLDHLLKHIDGKVAPGSTERFRRCYNTEGIMEYWLESADLVQIKREAGIPDPNYVPPAWWKSACAGEGGAGGSNVSGFLQDSVSAGELKLLRAELEKMKRDMQELLFKPRVQEPCNSTEMPKELVKWKATTDHQMMVISCSLSSMQDAYKDLIKWKAKSEQQLMEISNSLSNMQSSKQYTTFSPANPERWEDWLEGTNLDDLPGADFGPLLENPDLFNAGREAADRDPYSAQAPQMKPGESRSDCCIREVEILKEEMAKMKRDVRELVPRRREEDQINVTPDSSVTINSKSDVDNSVLVSQEMLKELVEWRPKMEEELTRISKIVSALKASKQHSFPSL